MMPWLPYNATEFLKDVLEPWMRVFEYGSGGSTVFFALRVAEVVSVEHDPMRHLDTGELVIENGLTNCKLLRIEPEDGVICADKSSPLCYYSDRYPGKNFKKYASAIDRYKPFDIVLVDGRARPSCLEHSYKKVVPGGFLILDNSDRVYYTVPIEVAMTWKRIFFFGEGSCNDYPWECTLWQRPDG